ncbi:MAG: TIGR00266 family protein [Spirochaetia bacterium]|nr:TIGR00266 family protein [Spirochaetia bacterium]
MSSMKHTITCSPDYSLLTVNIPAGNTVKVEASAMAAMDTNIKMKTRMKGGLGRLLTRESLFINEFTAEGGDGDIMIAPGSPGDLKHISLDGNVVYLQNSGYVASGLDVTLETKWQGMMKGFFSGESLFLIKCSGKGDLWFNSYGGIIEIDVKGEYIVDTGYIVAFEETLDYNVQSVGGLKSLFFSGEGLVCRFSGSGKLWIQTRNVMAFANWTFPYRPVKKSN